MKYWKNLLLDDIIEIIDGEYVYENWEPIEFNPNRYQISSFGRVKSLSWEKRIPHLRNNPVVIMKPFIMKQKMNHIGYLSVVLNKNAEPKQFMVHRLVGAAFLKNPLNKPFINHLDCDPSNNLPFNLEWCTQSENIKYSFSLGRKKIPDFFYDRKIGKYNQSSKKVMQYDIHGNLLKEWECITDIQRELGFNRPNICKCCKGKIPTAYGFIWQYK